MFGKDPIHLWRVMSLWGYQNRTLNSVNYIFKFVTDYARIYLQNASIKPEQNNIIRSYFIWCLRFVLYCVIWSFTKLRIIVQFIGDTGIYTFEDNFIVEPITLNMADKNKYVYTDGFLSFMVIWWSLKENL